MSAVKHFMLDIETADTRPTAAILSIGCVALTGDGEISSSTYIPVSMDSCLKAGLTVGAGTLGWWMKQDADAREVWREATEGHRHALGVALDELTEFMWGAAPHRDFEVWGNGVDFDNIILANAYETSGRYVPWKFWQNACFRTLKKRWGAVIPEPEFEGTKHNAIDDARHQARWLAKILEAEKKAIALLAEGE